MSAEDSRFVIGLGNPGRRYEKTRHNAGFRVVGRLWKVCGAESPRRFRNVEYGLFHVEGLRVFVGRPLSFMNRSGAEVKEFLRYFRGQYPELAVVHDDLDLPVGSLKVRRSGSSGGHKGVASIIEALGSEDFARFKIGIGRPSDLKADMMDKRDYGQEGGCGEDVVEFVLDVPCAGESKAIEEAESRASEAVRVWLREGVGECMSRFN